MCVMLPILLLLTALAFESTSEATNWSISLGIDVSGILEWYHRMVRQL